MTSLNDYLMALFLGIVEGLTEFSGQLDAHLRILRGLVRHRSRRRLLEDVFDRDPAGRDSLPPHLLLGTNRELFATYPGGVRGDKTAITHPLASR